MMRTVLLVWLLGWVGVVSALSVEGVRFQPTAMNPGKGDAVTLQFRLSDKTRQVDVRFYDAREYLVRTVTLGSRPAGEQSIQWDGHDDSGQVLPPEAYHFVIEAEGYDGERALYDMSDSVVGEFVSLKDLRWDPEKRLFRYVLAKPARVSIRVGLDDRGPILNTVRNWVARDAGLHEESWDGFDMSGVIDVSKHAHLMVVGEAFALPPNTVFLQPASPGVLLKDMENQSPVIRQRVADVKHRMHDHSQQTALQWDDFPIRLTVIDGSSVASGQPVPVRGKIRVKIDAELVFQQKLLVQRFEQVVYIDGKFIYENELGYLPVTYQWDTRMFNNGIHYLTVNLRGYDGNFGMATLKVDIQNKRSSP